MKVIEEKSWGWTLYQRDDEYILSVLCGAVAMYDVSIILNPNETAQYLQFGIGEIAKKINHKPNNYQSRQISAFRDEAAVIKADENWRNYNKS